MNIFLCCYAWLIFGYSTFLLIDYYLNDNIVYNLAYKLEYLKKSSSSHLYEYNLCNDLDLYVACSNLEVVLVVTKVTNSSHRLSKSFYPILQRDVNKNDIKIFFKTIVYLW